MNQSKFNIDIGDKIVFLGEIDSCFNKNSKYEILAIDNIGEYPFNETHHFDLVKNLKHPVILTIKDKKNTTFFLIYADDGFYRDS